MTAGISLIPGKTGALRAPLQSGSGAIPEFSRNLLVVNDWCAWSNDAICPFSKRINHYHYQFSGFIPS